MLAAVIFFVIAATASTLAISTISSFLNSVNQRNAVVAIWLRALGGIPLGMMFLSGTVLLLLSLRRDRAEFVAKPAMAVVFVFFLLVFITPWAASLVIDSRLSGLGYTRCVAIYERPISYARWARSNGDCPRRR